MRIEKEKRRFFVLCVLLSLAMLLLVGATCVKAEEKEEAHLYDNAGLFSQSEKEELESVMLEAVKKNSDGFCGSDNRGC